jgi:hypothetical protein
MTDFLPPIEVFEDTASVYSDGRPGSIDPAVPTRNGWYFRNALAGQKINWYFFDGSVNNITVQNFSAYAVVTLDSTVSKPYLAVYTKPTGSGDFAPWFKSSKVFLMSSGVVGTKYLIYFGQDPQVHLDLPRIELTPGFTNGSFGNSEEILTIAFSTSSGAAVNSVKLLTESLGINATTFKQEYELEIRNPAGLWSLNNPPLWPKKCKEYKNDSIVLTQSGWTVLRTGEVLVAMGGRLIDAGVSDVVDIKFTEESYERGDPLTVKVVFNEKVDVTAGATVSVSWTGGNFNCSVPSNLTGVYEVLFQGVVPSAAGTLSLSPETKITGTIRDTGTVNASNLNVPVFLNPFFKSVTVA